MFSLGMQFGFGFMAAVIIVNLIDDVCEWFIQCNKTKKAIDKRYYFISYVGINNMGNWTVGHCTVDAIKTSLPTLAESIQKEYDFKNPATIITIKELTKDDYDLLNGKQNGN